jgi:hypothetical protein
MSLSSLFDPFQRYVVEYVTNMRGNSVDANCLCKAKSFQKAGGDEIPRKCPAAADQASFINFINVVCSGQNGYPLSIKERSAAVKMGVSGIVIALAAAGVLVL